MKKKVPVMISIIAILYAVIFAVVLLITMVLPSSVYGNPDLIIQGFNSANKMNYRMRTQDGITTVKCGKMTGMDTIWKYGADEDMTLQMYYDFKVTSGKAKLVLITPDDTIITLAEQDCAERQDEQIKGTDTAGDSNADTPVMESVTALNLKKGENRIKIVCEKAASFSLSFQISE